MRARHLALVGLVVLAVGAGPAGAQRLQINPYGALGFAVPVDPDLCKVGTSGVDEDARETARHIAEAPGSPPELELNNCHRHPVSDTFSVSSGTVSPCHPDHEPPNGNCGRPLVEWCDNPCVTNACGQTNCLRAECPVIETTHEVLAPTWNYEFPLDASNSHELLIDALHQRKELRGNCTCTTYSTAACPTGPVTFVDPVTGETVSGVPDADGNVSFTDSRGQSRTATVSFSADSGDQTAIVRTERADGTVAVIEATVTTTPPATTTDNNGNSNDGTPGQPGRSGATQPGPDGDGNRG